VANRVLAEQLEQAGPWGQAFPEPLFCGVFEVKAWRVVGERHLKLDLRTACGAEVPAIEFQGWRDQPPGARVELVYQLQTDDFRDRRATQLLVRDRRDC
jgi:single-stranded-DNA-specific exonuclease